MGTSTSPTSSCCCCCCPLSLHQHVKMGRVKDAWAPDTDLANRDPTPLNDHLKVTFEEILGEPDHTQSLDCVWKYSYKCFNMCKTLCYLILTTLCGIPTAICWGCYFACVASFTSGTVLHASEPTRSTAVFSGGSLT